MFGFCDQLENVFGDLMKKKKAQLVIITKGTEDGGSTATFGAKLALSFLSMGVETSIFLTLAGTHWAIQGSGLKICLPGELSLEEYFEGFEELGGTILVCSPCVEAYCSISFSERDLNKSPMRKCAHYAGMASVAERMLVGNATVL